jgi:hypothetical protein
MQLARVSWLLLLLLLMVTAIQGQEEGEEEGEAPAEEEAEAPAADEAEAAPPAEEGGDAAPAVEAEAPAAEVGVNFPRKTIFCSVLDPVRNEFRIRSKSNLPQDPDHTTKLYASISITH